METNKTQGIEKKYDADGSLSLYCMVCGKFFASRLAPGKHHDVIDAKILIHTSSREHKSRVNAINKQRR